MKQKKSKTNKIKRSNVKHSKLTKQGKLKHKRNNKALPKLQLPVQSVNTVDEEEQDSDNVLQMVDPDDLEFLKKAVADRSYSIYNNVLHRTDQTKRKHKSDDESDNIENQYENEILPASISKKRTRHLLPVKTALGFEKRTIEEDIEQEEEDGEQQFFIKSEEDKSSDVEFELGNVEKDSFSRPMSTAEILALREQSLAQYKLQIGVLSSSLLEDPQLKIKNISLLLDLMKNCQPELQLTVRKLIMVSLTEVFKDIVPGYQIKHQDDPAVRLKKETRMLQNFEKSLLKGYRIFLTRLEKYASVLYKKKGDTRKRTEQTISLGEVALRCLCELLVNQPYFNYSPNIVQLIIPYLDNPSPNVRKMVADYVMQVLKSDKRGEISLDIVRRVNYVIKSRSHCVHSELISILIALPMKDINLDQEKENELKQKQLTNKQKYFAMSKKEKKRNKRLQELEQELLETKAEENKQKKQHNLTEVMKVVFTIYFRILKKAPTSKVLSCALAGLAKFAHCINIEFYEDLVNVIDGLMAKGTLNCGQQLHCVETVFKILSGQGQFLNIDPLRFYTHLYRNILHVHSGKSHEDAETILRVLDTVLVQRHKRITQHRLLAFAKRVTTLATQTMHNGTLGCLGVLKRVMQVGKSVDVLLDVDSSLGQGIYDPFLEEPEHCNASSTALWELTALHRHYHQAVRSLTQYISAGAQSGNSISLSPELAKMSALELFKEYDPSDVAFKPAVPAPQPFNPQSKVAYTTHGYRDPCLERLEKQTMSSSVSADFRPLFQKR